MSIIFHEDCFFLETADTSYQIKKDSYGVLEHLWYGPKTNQVMDYLYRYPDVGMAGSIWEAGNDRTYSLDTRLQEYPGAGTGDYRILAGKVLDENGFESMDLRYVSHTVYNGRTPLEGLPYVRQNNSEAATLEIRTRDTYSGLEAVLVYVVFEKENIICRSVRFENRTDKILRLNQAASLSLDFPAGNWDCIHFQGRHAMERAMERTRLPFGVSRIQSLRGTSSHQENPGVILAAPETSEDAGECCGCLLMYSGSFLTEIQKDQMSQTRLTTGIHPDLFAWNLAPGEVFQTPEALLAYSQRGLNALSQTFHHLIRSNIIPSRFQKRPRPILINNWEATYFDFDKTKILDIAKSAAPLGIDMLVLDDGWFGKRDDDNSGLGDWFVNEKKLHGSMSSLIQDVHNLGMKFGLWIEPEMVSEDSDLFRSRPDWALLPPNGKPVRGRNQLVLDFSREEVVNHIFEKIAAILEKNPIDYIKWDMNRSICNWYSMPLTATRQKELPHRYMLGVYDLLERLTNRFPDILFEGCSGGGGRFDAGMLFYTPQIWCSDNTDAHDRSIIHHGTSFFYPLSAIGAHVSAVPNHQNGRETSWAARAAEAMHGSFGYELDLSSLEENEKEQIINYNRVYKYLQPLLYEGDYYRLTHPQKDGSALWMVVSKDRQQALVQGLVYETGANSLRLAVPLKGLDPRGVYRLVLSDFQKMDGTHVYTGAALMHAGLILPAGWGCDWPVSCLLEKIA